MEIKYSLKEKDKIYKEWFTDDNIILKPLTGLERYNSVVNDEVIKNKKLIMEVLKLDNDDLIRLAIARDGDCTCRSFLCDKDDLINLRNLLLSVYPVESVSVSEEKNKE
jgi:hypothetical protein